MKNRHDLNKTKVFQTIPAYISYHTGRIQSLRRDRRKAAGEADQ